MRLLFVSDVHLKEHQNSEYIEFVKFLKFILKTKTTDHLFLVGDVFDIWVSNKPIFFKYFSEVINLLLEIANQGTQVHYFEGNHDIYLNAFFKDKKNIFTYNSPEYFTFNDLRFKIEHGDLINKKDYWYLKWKKLLHSYFFKTFVKITPGFFIFYLGVFLSFLSSFKRKFFSGSSKLCRDKLYKEHIRKMIRSYAETDCKGEESVDIFIHGHVHVPDFYQYMSNGKKKYSINLGEWRNLPHVLSVENKDIKFSSLEDFLSRTNT